MTRLMSPITRFLLGALLPMTLMACALAGAVTPAETPTAAPPPPAPPAARTADCLVGTWEITDVQGFMTSVLPSLLPQFGKPEYKGTSGTFRFTFTSDGSVSAEASQFTINYSVSQAILTVALDLVFSGSIAGTYQTTPAGGLSLASPAPDELTFSAILAGATLLKQPLGQLIPIFGGADSGVATGSYICEGSTLQYTPPLSGANPLVFTRTNP